MNTQSIEELKAALALAEQKLYEEKQAIAEAERKEKNRIEEEARKIAEAKAKLAWETTAKAIVVELKAVGFHNANYIMGDAGKYPAIKCFAADNYPAWNVEFETSYSQDQWHPRENGTVINVGQYGEKSRYPQLKAGGFNYKKIAATAWEKYQTAMVKRKRANTEEENNASNKARIDRLTTEFGTPAYKGADYKNISNVNVTSETYRSDGRGRNSCSYRSDNDLMLKVNHISEEKAAQLIQFMIDNGMISIEEK